MPNLWIKRRYIDVVGLELCRVTNVVPTVGTFEFAEIGENFHQLIADFLSFLRWRSVIESYEGTVPVMDQL